MVWYGNGNRYGYRYGYGYGYGMVWYVIVRFRIGWFNIMLNGVVSFGLVWYGMV